VESKSGRVKAAFSHFRARAVELPASAVEALAARPDVSSVSLDRPNIAFGHVTATTGADLIRASNGINSKRLDGSGISIAIVDSGIDPRHVSFLDRNNNQRVVFSRDFTGEGRTDDPYGHGTHVASIAAAMAGFQMRNTQALLRTRI
jgi:subtilisin family serine protease